MEFYESFMKFNFPDDDVFCIEKDPLVTTTEGTKACECIVYISPKVALIEAKSSSPKEIGGDRFQAFICDIQQKFADSLRLFHEMRQGQHGEQPRSRLPVHLGSLKITPNMYAVCLIVHGHKIEWLVGLQDAFRDAMRNVITHWQIKDSQVKVFNEETALEYHLISAFIPKDERNTVRKEDGSISIEKTIEWFETHAQ